MNENKVVDYFLLCGIESANENNYLRNANEIIAENDENEYHQSTNKEAQQPIIALSLINATDGEKCPEEWEILNRTISGKNGNIHHGSLGGKEMYIIYRRLHNNRYKSNDIKENPLRNIGIHNETPNEKLDGSSIKILKTFSGKSADLNNNKMINNSIWLVYSRTTIRHSTFAVVDLILVHKHDHIPHGYYRIDTSLNCSLTGDDVFLCYRKAFISPPTLNFTPEILYQYPANSPNLPPLSSEAAIFCLPRGVAIEYWENFNENDTSALNHNLRFLSKKHQFNSFLLTVNGQRLYGAAIVFLERIDSSTISQTQLTKFNCHSTDDGVFFQTKCISFISRWPFINFFYSMLKVLREIVHQKSSNISLEMLISRFVNDIPFPTNIKPNVVVGLFDSTDPLILTYFHDVPLTRNAASFSSLIEEMDVDLILLIFITTLLEQKLVIHSLRLDVLMRFNEAIISMIYPLDWQCTYVPLCPLSLASFLEAPCPLIIGIDSHYFDLHEVPEGVVCIDIDAKTCLWPTNGLLLHCGHGEQKKQLQVNSMEELMNLVPKSPLKILRKKLHDLEKDEIFDKNLDRLRMTSVSNRISTTFKLSRERIDYDRRVRSTFIEFMLTILDGYQKFLIPITEPTTSNCWDTNNRFNFDAFLTSKSGTNIDFYSSLLSTQHFSRFVEMRTFGKHDESFVGISYFDYIQQRRQNLGNGKQFSLLPSVMDNGKRYENASYLPNLQPADTSTVYAYSDFPTSFHHENLHRKREKEINSIDQKSSENHQQNHQIHDSFSYYNEMTRTKIELLQLTYSTPISQRQQQQQQQQSQQNRVLIFIDSILSMGIILMNSKLLGNKIKFPIDSLIEFLLELISFYRCNEFTYRLLIELATQHQLYMRSSMIMKRLMEINGTISAVTYARYNQLMAEWKSDESESFCGSSTRMNCGNSGEQSIGESSGIESTINRISEEGKPSSTLSISENFVENPNQIKMGNNHPIIYENGVNSRIGKNDENSSITPNCHENFQNDHSNSFQNSPQSNNCEIEDNDQFPRGDGEKSSSHESGIEETIKFDLNHDVIVREEDVVVVVDEEEEEKLKINKVQNKDDGEMSLNDDILSSSLKNSLRKNDRTEISLKSYQCMATQTEEEEKMNSKKISHSKSTTLDTNASFVSLHRSTNLMNTKVKLKFMSPSKRLMESLTPKSMVMSSKSIFQTTKSWLTPNRSSTTSNSPKTKKNLKNNSSDTISISSTPIQTKQIDELNQRRTSLHASINSLSNGSDSVGMDLAASINSNSLVKDDVTFPKRVEQLFEKYFESSLESKSFEMDNFSLNCDEKKDDNNVDDPILDNPINSPKEFMKTLTKNENLDGKSSTMRKKKINFIVCIKCDRCGNLYYDLDIFGMWQLGKDVLEIECEHCADNYQKEKDSLMTTSFSALDIGALSMSHGSLIPRLTVEMMDEEEMENYESSHVILLSPIHLLKKLEKLIETESNIYEHRAYLFWNLVYYLRRCNFHHLIDFSPFIHHILPHMKNEQNSSNDSTNSSSSSFHSSIEQLFNHPTTDNDHKVDDPEKNEYEFQLKMDIDNFHPSEALPLYVLWQQKNKYYEGLELDDLDHIIVSGCRMKNLIQIVEQLQMKNMTVAFQLYCMELKEKHAQLRCKLRMPIFREFQLLYIQLNNELNVQLYENTHDFFHDYKTAYTANFSKYIEIIKNKDYRPSSVILNCYFRFGLQGFII
ncbi:hypothetical protein SNEBB_008754 [Seison nebaliae]|nr:hypothetical protein SNEBB_008754 [Seison nebaliae]